MTTAYRRAGVDIRAADHWLARLQPLIRSTRRPEVLRDLGQFAGLFRLNRARYRDPVLVSSTDGVGTKLKVAQLTGLHEGIGIDCVAMNVNDVIIYGAEPLFFLDYLAVGKIEPRLMTALVRGVVAGCKQSGCTLLGGETAEMPGAYPAGEYDLAGFCVAVAERRRLIDGSQVRAGDAIVGLASSGVHANGFSLVRKALSRRELLRWKRELMTPTRIYVQPILRALAHVQIRAMAHVTGGGMSRRIPSLVSRAPGLRARVQRGRWPMPKIFQIIQEAGGISPTDMFGTFNMGIGMALVCRQADARRLLQLMARAGVPAWTIGMIERT